MFSSCIYYRRGLGILNFKLLCKLFSQYSQDIYKVLTGLNAVEPFLRHVTNMLIGLSRPLKNDSVFFNHSVITLKIHQFRAVIFDKRMEHELITVRHPFQKKISSILWRRAIYSTSVGRNNNRTISLSQMNFGFHPHSHKMNVWQHSGRMN